MFMRPTRLIAIGDIHGQLDQLNRLLNLISPSEDDRLIFLGDYVDRGQDSKGVIERLIAFGQSFPDTVFIRGNHDQMLLDSLVELGVRSGVQLRDQSTAYAEYLPESDLQVFLSNGGRTTLADYNFSETRNFPPEHLKFLETTRLWWRYQNFVFVHAGIDPDLPPELQDPFTLLWKRSSPVGKNGEIHVVGHNPTRGEPYFEPGRYNLDTGAVYGRKLTACDVLTRSVWQV